MEELRKSSRNSRLLNRKERDSVYVGREKGVQEVDGEETEKE
jgi:hypothetical protein